MTQCCLDVDDEIIIIWNEMSNVVIVNNLGSLRMQIATYKIICSNVERDAWTYTTGYLY